MGELAFLVPPENARELRELFDEYNAQQTPEAILCKDLDRFEMILQAFEYEQEHSTINLEEFFRTTSGCFRTPLVQQWARHLYEERGKYATRNDKV